MEVTLRNEFCELTMDEMQFVDGGAPTVAGAFNAACKGVTSVVAGCIVASFIPYAPVAYIAGAAVTGVVAYVWDNV